MHEPKDVFKLGVWAYWSLQSEQPRQCWHFWRFTPKAPSIHAGECQVSSGHPAGWVLIIEGAARSFTHAPNPPSTRCHCA